MRKSGKYGPDQLGFTLTQMKSLIRKYYGFGNREGGYERARNVFVAYHKAGGKLSMNQVVAKQLRARGAK